MEALAARDRLADGGGASASISCRSRCRRSTRRPTTCCGSRPRSTSLQESLGQVDELAKKTAWQYENLKQSRQDLESLRKEIQDFYKSHAAAVQLRDRLAADRAALEAFLERTTAFSAGLPELEARMDAITGKLAIVDEGTQKAANLVSIADDLDRQMTRIATQQQFVERVEARLNTLNVADLARSTRSSTSRSRAAPRSKRCAARSTASPSR